MKGMIVSFFIELGMLILSGTGFVFGLFLVFDKKCPILSAIIILVSIVVALILSVYEVTIVDIKKEGTYESYERFKERNRAA